MSDQVSTDVLEQVNPIDMNVVRVDPYWAFKVPASLARRHTVLPCCKIKDEVLVACVDQDDTQAIAKIEQYIDNSLKFFIAEETSLEAKIKDTFGGTVGRTGSIRVAAMPGADDDTVAICDEILQAAALRQASDIHIDPEDEEIRVRMRVDGVLEEYRRLNSGLAASIASRIKVLGEMDIAERRSPQDGRFAWTSSQGVEIDIRAATLPTRNGECITLRLLASHVDTLSLKTLGMRNDDLEIFSRALERPHGMILITGPTGSGKSTTLYTGLQNMVNQRPLHVVTVEDPIEYEMNGVAQVAVDAADKVSFNRALRSILRHDPDVIMIGEIRDNETADIAIKSSLTGHLVFSTLHTNNAASAITRMTDMGVAPFLTGATVRLVVAQRLVRGLCQHCRLPTTLSETDAQLLGDPEAAGKTAYTPGECVYCAGRGLIGRMGIFEMLEVGEDLSRTIARGADESTVLEMARSKGSRQLTHDALHKVLHGQISVREAISAVTIW